jgi:hypothetical protein
MASVITREEASHATDFDRRNEPKISNKFEKGMARIRERRHIRKFRLPLVPKVERRKTPTAPCFAFVESPKKCFHCDATGKCECGVCDGKCITCSGAGLLAWARQNSTFE